MTNPKGSSGNAATTYLQKEKNYETEENHTHNAESCV